MEHAVYAFCLEGTPVRCEAFGHGHINSTFKIDTDLGAEYVLQRINTYVFKDPVGLMNNAGAITDFIRERVDDPRLALHFLTTKDGKFYYEDEKGEFWRMYDFVGGFCLDTPECEDDFYQSALAFGRFQQMLSEFPAETLTETILSVDADGDIIFYNQIIGNTADDMLIEIAVNEDAKVIDVYVDGEYVVSGWFVLDDYSNAEDQVYGQSTTALTPHTRTSAFMLTLSSSQFGKRRRS